jgi:hypothetical protein
MQITRGQIVKVATTGEIVRALHRRHGKWVCGDGWERSSRALLPASAAEVAAYRDRLPKLVSPPTP